MQRLVVRERALEALRDVRVRVEVRAAAGVVGRVEDQVRPTRVQVREGQPLAPVTQEPRRDDLGHVVGGAVVGGPVVVQVVRHEAGADEGPEVVGLHLPRRLAHRVLERGPVVEVAAGERAAECEIVFKVGADVDNLPDGVTFDALQAKTGAPLIASAQPMMVEIYMALVPMLLGCLLFGYGLTRVTPSAARTLTLAEPAIAALLAVVLVGESYEPTSTPWRPRSSLPRSSRSRMRCSALWLPLPR